jgi:hypothetical protein
MWEIGTLRISVPRRQWSKSFQYRVHLLIDFVDGRDKVQHGHLRRVMKPVANTNIIDETSPTIELFLQRLVSGMEEDARQNQGLVELKTWLYNFTFAVRLVGAYLMVDDRISFLWVRV